MSPCGIAWVIVHATKDIQYTPTNVQSQTHAGTLAMSSHV